MKTLHKTLGRVAGIGAMAAVVAVAAFAPATAAHAQARPGFENGRGRDWPDTNRDTDDNIRQLRTTLNTDRTSYGSDRGVAITLTLENTGRNPIEIRQRDVYEYDIIIRSRSGETVWQSSRSGNARRQNRTLRLESGESRTYREIWDQRTSDGRRVSDGTYTIEASVYPKGPMTTQVYLSGGNDDRNDGGWDRPGGGWGGSSRPGWGDRNSDLRGEIKLSDSRLDAGDRVRIEYTVTNRGRNTETLRFENGQQFEIEVRSPDSRNVIWRYSSERRYGQWLSELKLDPNERKTFSAEWRPDRDLRQGTYEITAYLPVSRNSNGDARTQSSVRLDGRGWNDGGSRPGGGWNDRWGGTGWGNRGAWTEQGSGSDGRNQNLRTITARDLALRGGDYLGQHVSVTGSYRGPDSVGFLGMCWVVQSDGQSAFITGPEPPSSIRVGDKVRVAGTVRRAPDGRHYLQPD